MGLPLIADLSESVRSIALTQLIGHAHAVDLAQTLNDVHDKFGQFGPGYLGVVEGRRLVGICSRAGIGHLLGGRYGVALYGQQAVRNFLIPDGLVMEADTPILEALEAALLRPAPEFDDDVALVDEEGNYLGLISTATLVRVQSRLVTEQFRELDDQRADAVGRNAELVAMTERLNGANCELERARDAAQAANRMKSMFLANMSHEIRTPMNGVMGCLQLLLQTPLEDDQRDLATTAQSSADALLVVIDDILNVAQIEAGKLRIESKEFNLGRMVNETATLASKLAQQKDLDFRWTLDPTIPELLLGDSVRLRQILTNLLGNAIKFTDQGGVNLAMRRLGNGENCDLRCEVTDTGTGIAPEHQRQLFQPFAQADMATTRRVGGTGLGLAISKQLVELMGGRIGLRSTLGMGSHFWFEVSLQVPRIAAETDPAAGTNSDSLTLKVLVVEDNPVNQRVTAAQLRQLGCTPEIASNGRAALAALEADRYDLVLMDCHMPDMDGFEATMEIRRRERENQVGHGRLPILALTASAMAEDRDRCLAVGMDGCVTKPTSPAALRTALTAVTADQPLR
jgi:signal transduction histidine kinase/ActR/RegA family two-component response regulator